jgi:exodeoxyribonuclease VII large subunit
MPPFPRTPSGLVDGAQVQVYGNVSVFEARGQYQLSVQILQPRGLGVLQARFEALKRKLEAEGLFGTERKRALPKFPRRIGIVTSPSGAAIRDILNVLKRRAPWLQILINPVRVQGSGAAAEIAVAIRELATPNENWAMVDLIVVARGGGSIEDLWEFNEEIVARTVADVGVPIVSAIGHEIDFTIADFVADLRAPTPSAAAELIVPDIVDLRRRIEELSACLHKCLRNFVQHQRTRLRFLSDQTLVRNLVARMREAQQRFDLIRDSLARLTKQRIDNARERFQRADAILRVLGPDATLRRGYSITTDGDGKLIRSVASVRPKMKIRTRVSDGEFGSDVSNS